MILAISSFLITIALIIFTLNWERIFLPVRVEKYKDEYLQGKTPEEVQNALLEHFGEDAMREYREFLIREATRASKK